MPTSQRASDEVEFQIGLAGMKAATSSPGTPDRHKAILRRWEDSQARVREQEKARRRNQRRRAERLLGVSIRERLQCPRKEVFR